MRSGGHSETNAPKAFRISSFHPIAAGSALTPTPNKCCQRFAIMIHLLGTTGRLAKVPELERRTVAATCPFARYHFQDTLEVLQIRDGIGPIELVKKAGYMAPGRQRVRGNRASPHDCTFKVKEPNLKSFLSRYPDSRLQPPSGRQRHRNGFPWGLESLPTARCCPPPPHPV